MLGNGRPTTPRLQDAIPMLGRGRTNNAASQNKNKNSNNNDGVTDEWNAASAEIDDSSSLASYDLPQILRFDPNDPNLSNGAGMEVIKVSKNGKQQSRRIAISLSNRALLITTNRPQSVREFFTRGKSNDSPPPLKEVDLSTIIRIQHGQQSRRFTRARSKNARSSFAPSPDRPSKSQNLASTNSSNSLSIIYRRPLSTSSSVVGGGIVRSVSFIKSPRDATSRSDRAGAVDGGESLDFIVTSAADYEVLTRVLDDLMRLYSEEEPRSNPDLALLQYHWVAMGKKLGKGGAADGGMLVSAVDWTNLCKRLNAPVSKAEALSIYRKYCSSLGMQPMDEGLGLSGSVRMLDLLRRRGLDAASQDFSSSSSGIDGGGSGRSKDSAPGKTIEDPRKRLFRRIVGDSTVPGGSMTGEDSQMVSASAFLEFLHDKQRETDIFFDGVKDLFDELNGHSLTQELENALTFEGGMSQDGIAWEREYITWELFARYLLMDANDAYNPSRTRPLSRYMNQPISNYWIYTSHDTYIRRDKKTGTDQMDLQSYTSALYRGARAIELDVWDGPLGSSDPVVRFGESFSGQRSGSRSGSSSFSSLLFADVIRTVGSFLQSEPNTYPVILLVENHCSLKFQEKIGLDLEEILGKEGLMYIPNQSCNEHLPSPEQLVGKVIVKSKRPDEVTVVATVLNDDFDDENIREQADSILVGNIGGYDSDYDIEANVIGFNADGSVTSDFATRITPDEIYQIAKREAIEAKSNAKEATMRLSDSQQSSLQAQNHVDALLRDIGYTYDELRIKREAEMDLSNTYSEEGMEVELFDDAVRVKDDDWQGFKVAAIYADAVEESQLLLDAANTEARSEAELFDIAYEDLAEKDTVLTEVKNALREASKRKHDLSEAADRALSDARSNREYADNAEHRVAAVKALLNKSHDQAITSETVAGTASTESKISEQRARDAEARAQKARAHAERERLKAEEEIKLEENLEAQLINAHTKSSNATAAVKAVRARVSKAVSMSEKLSKEIREIESSPDYSLAKESEKISCSSTESMVADTLVKHKAKCVEKKCCAQQLKDAVQERLMRESKSRRLEVSIEELKRKTKLQGKVAVIASRQAHYAVSAADQLEEHAEEEREAANLRTIAREKAQLGAESSDAVLISTEAQLVEAEKAAIEARNLTVTCRLRAEQLENEAKAARDISKFEEDVKVCQGIRDISLSAYESAKESKEVADQRAAEAKQVHETNLQNLANAERDVMADLLRKESIQQAEFLAITACENGQKRKNEVRAFEETRNQAESEASDKATALEFAKRYKEKMIRVQPVSESLAKLTFLHSKKFKYWEKSLGHPNWYMHSFPENRILEGTGNKKEEWGKCVEFNMGHFSRVYPATRTRNYNPLLPWAMGCQFVSMNFLSEDEHLLLNDGRFRENCNLGYVLKPDYLCNKPEHDSSAINDALDSASLRKINIRVLSGYCIPKPEMSKGKKVITNTGHQKISINPFVKVTLYDGSPATLKPPPTYTTSVVLGNGLNPVWNERDAANFACFNPSVGMILFSVFDRCDLTKSDILIAGSAVPVSCLREGFRSVALFDSNNTRSGAMKFASLFIKVKMEAH